MSEGFCQQCRTLAEWVSPITKICAQCKQDNDESEIANLKAEIERLRDMLEDVKTNTVTVIDAHGGGCYRFEYGVKYHDRLAALLEGK